MMENKTTGRANSDGSDDGGGGVGSEEEMEDLD